MHDSFAQLPRNTNSTKRVRLTQKIAIFKATEDDVRDPNTSRGLKCVGGIHDVLACRLHKAGVENIDDLRKCTKHMNRSEFSDYMRTTCKANVLQSGMAFKSLYSKVDECAIQNKLNSICNGKQNKRS